MNIKLVLTCEVAGLGRKGDVVQVSKGYARNFLLPKKFARVVAKDEIERIEQEKEAEKVKLRQELAAMKDIKQKLHKKRISIKQKASKSGRLYAAVSAEDIASAIYKTYGCKLPKDSIKIGSIKTLGLHLFRILLPDNQEILMKVKVEAL